MQNIIKPTVGHSLGIIYGSKNSSPPPPLNKFKYNTEDYTFKNNTSYKHK